MSLHTHSPSKHTCSSTCTELSTFTHQYTNVPHPSHPSTHTQHAYALHKENDTLCSLTFKYTMTHMNPHTQPKHTWSIPSTDFPLSLPLLLAGTTCQGVFSGEIHALQLTQWQGLISYLSDLLSQDQVLFPHTASFASYPRKVGSFPS